MPGRARHARRPGVLQRGHGRGEARPARVRRLAPRAPPRDRAPPRVLSPRRHRHRDHRVPVAPHPLRQRPPRRGDDARVGPRVRDEIPRAALRRRPRAPGAQRGGRVSRGRHGGGHRAPTGARLGPRRRESRRLPRATRRAPRGRRLPREPRRPHRASARPPQETLRRGTPRQLVGRRAADGRRRAHGGGGDERDRRSRRGQGARASRPRNAAARSGIGGGGGGVTNGRERG